MTMFKERLRSVKVNVRERTTRGGVVKEVRRVEVTRERVRVRTPSRTAPLTVTLPDLPAVPEAYRAPRYVVRELLGDGDSNPKLRKSNAAGTAYKTWGLSLAPADESGYQMCASASPGCRAACLFHQGRGACEVTRAARIAKTVAFMEHRDWFQARLRHELSRIARKAHKEGFTPAIRLNVLSDVPWEKVFPWLFEEYPTFQVYDYTKHATRMLDWCEGRLPPNYYLTFSRSECNESDALRVLAAFGNISVVFRDDNFPPIWRGYPVVDGDETDLRFLDPRGVVVGLYAKGTCRGDGSGFVVETRRVPLPLAG
jgi:hypothetical protein